MKKWSRNHIIGVQYHSIIELLTMFGRHTSSTGGGFICRQNYFLSRFSECRDFLSAVACARSCMQTSRDKVTSNTIKNYHKANNMTLGAPLQTSRIFNTDATLPEPSPPSSKIDYPTPNGTSFVMIWMRL